MATSLEHWGHQAGPCKRGGSEVRGEGSRGGGEVRAASLGRELYSVVYNRNTEEVLSRGMTGCRMSHRDQGDTRQAGTLPGPATSPALPEELPGTCREGTSDRCGGLLPGASLLKDLDREPQGRGGPTATNQAAATARTNGSRTERGQDWRTEKAGPRKEPRGPGHQRAVARGRRGATRCPGELARSTGAGPPGSRGPERW